MQLTLKERLLLSMMLLPQQGDIVTLRVLKALKASLGFSEDELQKWNIKQEGQIFTWNPDLKPEDTVAEIEIGPAAFNIVKAQLKKLDEEKKLTEDAIDLWDKFCA